MRWLPVAEQQRPLCSEEKEQEQEETYSWVCICSPPSSLLSPSFLPMMSPGVGGFGKGTSQPQATSCTAPAIGVPEQGCVPGSLGSDGDKLPGAQWHTGLRAAIHQEGWGEAPPNPLLPSRCFCLHMNYWSSF